jgi:hypothetical protein
LAAFSCRQRFRYGLHTRESCVRKECFRKRGLRSLAYPRRTVTPCCKPRSHRIGSKAWL